VKKAKGLMVMVLLVAGFLSFPIFGLAQAKPVKGAIFYLKVPIEVFEAKQSIWSGLWLNATVQSSENGVSINNVTDWRLSGFPPMTELKVKKVNVVGKYGLAEIELSAGDRLSVKFAFEMGKGDQLFPEVLATKDEVDTYRTETYKLLAAKFFEGTPLAGISEEKKIMLCHFANVTANGKKVSTTLYKEKLYLLVDIGRDTSVYNEIRMNQIQRVAHVFNERLLTVLKGFTIPTGDDLNLFGLKLEFQIPHKNFMHEADEATYDKLEIYAPVDLIQKFAQAYITSQQFIDGCVVIVDGNRISVPLATT